MEKIAVKYHDNSATVMFLKPDIDDVIDSFKSSINALIDEDVQNIIIDMESVHHIHTPALGVIVFAYRRMEKLGRILRLKNVSPSLLKLLGTFELDKVLIIETAK